MRVNKRAGDPTTITINIPGSALVVLAIGMAVLAAGWTWTRPPAQPDGGAGVVRSPQPGSRIGSVRLTSIDDGSGEVESVSLDEAVGQPALVFVGTTTCPYCLASLPELETLVRSLPEGLGVDVILLDGRNGSAGSYLEFAKDKQVRLWATQSVEDARALGVRMVPTIVLLDSTGLVMQTWTGQVTPTHSAEVLESSMGVTSGRGP